MVKITGGPNMSVTIDLGHKALYQQPFFPDLMSKCQVQHCKQQFSVTNIIFLTSGLLFCCCCCCCCLYRPEFLASPAAADPGEPW